MKRIIFLSFVLSVMTVTLMYAKKLAALPEVSKPFAILVKNDQLLISDRTVKLHLYSMKDFRYVRQISRKGEGPGECRHVPIVTLCPNHIFIFSRGKGMFFSRNGDYKKENRIPVGKGISFISPVKENFVAIIHGRNTRNNNYYSDISIYTYNKDKEFKYKKLIYYLEEPPEEIKGGKKNYTVINDYLGFIVHDEKIFIGDSSRGLFVVAFDENGKEINRIHLLEIDKTKVTEQYKKEFMERAKTQPSYNIIKNMYNIIFPEYFPGFYRFTVDNGKVYFLTYLRKDNKREIIIADFKGKMLKRTFVPWVENDARINFSIENDKFYYIMESEQEEVWELHMEEIK